MPYGGNDWLALTQEPTLEPEIPICDPHHHFWDRRLQSLPYQPMVLVTYRLDSYTSILKTKFSDGEGYEARRTGL
jgi:hypothetical protein